MIQEKPKVCQCLRPRRSARPRRDYNTGPASQPAGHEALTPTSFKERIT
jgi:hypothetical protein